MIQSNYSTNLFNSPMIQMKFKLPITMNEIIYTLIIYKANYTIKYL